MRALMTTKWGDNQRFGAKSLKQPKAQTLSLGRSRADVVASSSVTRTAIEQVGRIEKAHPTIERAAERGIITIGRADALARKSSDDQQAEVDKWLGDAVRHKSFTPEQRQRAAQHRQLNAKPKKEIPRSEQDRLLRVIKLASWAAREFIWKSLWAMFGPAHKARLVEEVITPHQQERFGLGDGSEPPDYDGDVAEKRG
jgi:hypothetical protein